MVRLYADWVQKWDYKLATVSTDRVVRPFEWGEEWCKRWPLSEHVPEDIDDPEELLTAWNDAVIPRSDEFYAYQTPRDFTLTGEELRFTSAVETDYPENNRMRARYFAAQRKPGRARRAVVVLPHWNSQLDAHNGLCRMIRTLGISALRMSLPYHDVRMPAETGRADYAVSSNIGRTLDATRQAIIDVRSCLDWLQQQGYDQLGIVGTSLGSCYAFLASAHDERLKVNVFNHCSSYFADVVWTGLATRHIREGMEGSIDGDRLRRVWSAISPYPFIKKFASHRKKSLFIYAKYDSSFLPEYSQQILEEIQRHDVDYRVESLPCGHYTTGEAPYKYLDGWYIGRFLAGAFERESSTSAL